MTPATAASSHSFVVVRAEPTAPCVMRAPGRPSDIDYAEADRGYMQNNVKGWLLAGALMALIMWHVDNSAEGSADSIYPECPTWKCGFNSAELNGGALRELNLDGQANADRTRIVGLIAPHGRSGRFRLDVEDDALLARGSDGEELRGAELVGAVILVAQDDRPGLPRPVLVVSYREIDAWAEGAARVPIYTLLHLDARALFGQNSVCSEEGPGGLFTRVTVLGGETYDATTHAVAPDRPRWFTLACAGSALAKMRLMNYGPQSSKTTPAQRQATLRMLTADYCGTGVSYTKNGTPLAWKNRSGAVDTVAAGDAVESVWTENGALCLDTARIRGTAPACALPACADVPLTGGEWVTHTRASDS